MPRRSDETSTHKPQPLPAVEMDRAAREHTAMASHSWSSALRETAMGNDNRRPQMDGGGGQKNMKWKWSAKEKASKVFSAHETGSAIQCRTYISRHKLGCLFEWINVICLCVCERVRVWESMSKRVRVWVWGCVWEWECESEWTNLPDLHIWVWGRRWPGPLARCHPWLWSECSGRTWGCQLCRPSSTLGSSGNLHMIQTHKNSLKGLWHNKGGKDGSSIHHGPAQHQYMQYGWQSLCSGLLGYVSMHLRVSIACYCSHHLNLCENICAPLGAWAVETQRPCGPAPVFWVIWRLVIICLHLGSISSPFLFWTRHGSMFLASASAQNRCRNTEHAQKSYWVTRTTQSMPTRVTEWLTKLKGDAGQTLLGNCTGDQIYKRLISFYWKYWLGLGL